MLKKYLLTGLLIWIPLGITIWVLQLIIGTMDQIGSILPSAARPDYWLLQHLAEYLPILKDKQHIPGFGLVFAVAVVFVTGVIARNVLGRRLLIVGEQLLNRIPIVRSIYSSVKQVSDTLFSDSGQAFRKAVLVQFPHQGTWAVGFLTGQPGGEIAELLTDDLVSVFVPTTPNPTSGFLFMAKKTEVRELAMSVDEALKYVISMGVVMPGSKVAAAPKTVSVSTTESGELVRADQA
ncbi:DUF502 domain-containing protein [Andreprevotia chitinilytica]|uniref:DUF502 domain-containing protein n=1 Tax=Andreprevotia chitinilytica TaxID=396808 RepID=UPI00055009D5|nr:DUF502 domain-containing protein [Andreprevotia chitinilytica]